ncbi:MAG: YiiX/YebB-like N1pC/P60 family cysteine hydrolase [Nanoarchaeota archaeon]|nr:hypothetical protein [Nanoarchaeota archaeon]MBU1631961.1 hypothetical protein [Nanoarchaeota archaeon]MBU1876418.1 hypothetical protein [Nanoarchaeota archaeon]
MISTKYHIIHNYPRNYPFYRKIIDNIIFFISATIIHPRKNLLTQQDLRKAKYKLRKGDIILIGILKTILSQIIPGVINHSAMYVGRRKFIHSNAGGVHYMSFHELFTENDTLAIVRIPKSVKERRKIIRQAIKYAKNQYGKPYDFEFKKGSKCFFCTELVNEAYKEAGYKTGFSSLRKYRSISKKFEEKITSAADALLPADFLKGRFELVFLSHNLRVKKKEFILVKD